MCDRVCYFIVIVFCVEVFRAGGSMVFFFFFFAEPPVLGEGRWGCGVGGGGWTGRQHHVVGRKKRVGVSP